MAKPGPRPGGEYAARGATISARITVGNRQRLAAAAAANERSISAELEARLAQSFGETADLRDWGSDYTYKLLRQIAEGIKNAEGFVGQPWHRDLFARDLVAEFVHQVLEHFRPKRKVKPPESFPNISQLDSFPEEKAALRSTLASRPIRQIAAPIADAVIAELQAAAASGSTEFGISQQNSSALVPMITNPVLPLGETE